MNWFLPRKTQKVLSESELIFASLKRNRVYSQDILSETNLAALLALEERYPALLKARDVDGLEKLNKEAMKLGNRHFPASQWDGWRENVEVFVVAAIMALSIRTYFLQPFKIPTGSMEPTLYGIEPTPTDALPPNLLVQAYAFLIEGKTYGRTVTEHGGTIDSMTSGTLTIWLEYTDLHLGDETDRIWIRQSDVREKLHLSEGMTFKPGDVLANFVTQTGDEVLVDKVTYNFRSPRRGEVIIFTTSGIQGINQDQPEQEGSQDFIKRCTGLAGDLITVKPPLLYVQTQGASANNLESDAPAFEKEFTQTEAYPGYSLVSYKQSSGETQNLNLPYDPFDKNNSQTYYVPPDCYWAMGDNSPHSFDSRYWGGVPRQNLVGRGYFVFWPFTSRWGWIR